MHQAWRLLCCCNKLRAQIAAHMLASTYLPALFGCVHLIETATEMNINYFA